MIVWHICLGYNAVSGVTDPSILACVNDPEILTVIVDGCDFGMKDKNGTPIRNQWRIATNSPDLAAALEKIARVITRRGLETSS